MKGKGFYLLWIPAAEYWLDSGWVHLMQRVDGTEDPLTFQTVNPNLPPLHHAVRGPGQDLIQLVGRTVRVRTKTHSLSAVSEADHIYSFKFSGRGQDTSPRKVTT